LVSGADKLDNLRSIGYDDPERIGEKIWSCFNASKEQQVWYHHAIASILQDNGKDIATLATFGNEMKELYKQVF